MADDEDFVTVKEAAHLTKVSDYRVYEWALNQRLPIKQGPYGLLVSLAAVRALVDDTAESAPSAGYIPLRTAARLTATPTSRVISWIREGKVMTTAGPHGQLVRLADVQELAEQRRRAAEQTGEGKVD